MNKRRLAVVVGIGLALAIFVSACGVAVGPVQFVAGGPGVLSPTFSGLHFPALQPAAVHTAEELLRFQPVSNVTLFPNHPLNCHSFE